MGSESARKLASALSSRRVYPDRNYRPSRNHVVINWGNNTYPEWGTSNTKVLNKPVNVAFATNKLETFQLFCIEGVPHPEWSQSMLVAGGWIQEGYKVFCRTTLTGHSGRGIVIASTVDELVDAPLYVKAVKKDKEYRVHVFNGRVIDFQLKRKKHGHEGGISGIWNHGNGWVYTREGVELPEQVKDASVRAVAALGLDFGAVDVCVSREGTVVVFEVNSAPGLHGTTLTKYVEAIHEICSR